MAMVAQSNVIQEENTWFAYSGANQHITTDLSNLTLQESYGGNDVVVVGNGFGIQIKSTGSFFLTTPRSSHVSLRNVLHCPTIMVINFF